MRLTDSLMFLHSCFDDLIHLLFPEVCPSCDRALFLSEQVLCRHCLHSLPVTGYHRDEENPVERIFWGRVDVKAATSLLFFSKRGSTQRLIHALKYKEREDVGFFLARHCGKGLQSEERFDADLIVPVPLHSSKLRKRGYNQCSSIAKGLSAALGIMAREDVLFRKKSVKSQTRKNRQERMRNVSNIFAVRKGVSLRGRRIMLVDDVVTTGATLESCALALLNAGAADVRIVTLACAS